MSVRVTKSGGSRVEDLDEAEDTGRSSYAAIAREPKAVSKPVSVELLRRGQSYEEPLRRGERTLQGDPRCGPALRTDCCLHRSTS